MFNLVTIIVSSFLVWTAYSQCQAPQTFAITCRDTGCGYGFLVNGVQNATIKMTKGNGCVYTFNINTPGKTFKIYRSNNNDVSSFNNNAVSGGVGTQTYQPDSFNTGAMSVGTTYYYAFCNNNVNSPNCPSGQALVLDPPPPVVDGAWSAWTGCTVACGGGVYTRACNNPAPANGGADCVGSAVSDIPCHTIPCGCRIDLMYVLDGSGSIVPQSWSYLKSFVIDLSGQIDLGNGSLAGIVQFSSDGSEEFETDNLVPPTARMIGDLSLIVEAINNMNQFHGYTAIGSGLKLGQYGLLTAGRWGLQPPVPKVILLITDGTSNQGEPPTPVAQRLRDNGTEIFVIGVGGDFDLAQLLSLPSDPREVHYFNITDYGALLQITNDVAYALCYSRGGNAPASLYLLLLLLLPLAAGIGMFAFIWRRRKPKKVVPPPEPEPVPVPVKAAAPAPIADKPKDWTVPGTRYIGFGQANIKVKWGADAPPSAPRGHDKYDRWSMQAQGGPLPPSSPSSAAPASAPEIDSTAVASGGASRDPGCCAKFCPCFFVGAAANSGNRAHLAKQQNEDEGQWQENAAASTNSGGGDTSPR